MEPDMDGLTREGRAVFENAPAAIRRPGSPGLTPAGLVLLHLRERAGTVKFDGNCAHSAAPSPSPSGPSPSTSAGRSILSAQNTGNDAYHVAGALR